jgi:hypothetical protein
MQNPYSEAKSCTIFRDISKNSNILCAISTQLDGLNTRIIFKGYEVLV